MDEKKMKVMVIIHDAILDIMYYDRKEDEDMPVGEIEKIIKSSPEFLDVIVEYFRSELSRT